MLFNTFQFAVFFVVVVSAYFALPHRYRWMLLLAASYYFYMCWNPPYLSIIIALTLIDYLAGIKIETSHTDTARRNYLLFSVASNLGLLFVFKYLNFATTSVGQALSAISLFPPLPHSDLLLPIGLSFHTFQALSYTIEVYRRRVGAERHLGRYALYVAFFPQLVAGPIERPYNLLPQFRRPTTFDLHRAQSGLTLLVWGLFKKAVVADLLATVVNTVYSSPRQFSGAPLLVATLFFAFQIYCDFSGYSDIAVGAARVLGYDLMINFRQPYFATSISEYWHRWHISLSSWFRDYAYIPLGGNRVLASRWCLNIMIVFLASGLWHGASWTFLIWGGLNGVYLIGERLSAPLRQLLLKSLRSGNVPLTNGLLGGVVTFGLISLAWVWFRAGSVADSLFIYEHIFAFRDPSVATLWALGLPRFEMVLALCLIGVVCAVEYIQVHTDFTRSALWAARPIRWTAYAACAYAIVFFGVFQRIQFIYFQF